MVMRDSEHRPERFWGFGLIIPDALEVRHVIGANSSAALPQAQRYDSSSSVEEHVLLGETIGELGDYLSGLSDAEILAVQAQVVFREHQDVNLSARVAQKLGVDNQRLMEIRKEMGQIILNTGLNSLAR